ncbi:MAG: tetrathionate reductase family octaheme c-type cytochrome [Nitrosomonadales bacterium]|nr:tetrathionate reductase family octaheme c-type cytochrome [Nitrosomonadales bacterium]
MLPIRRITLSALAFSALLAGPNAFAVATKTDALAAPAPVTAVPAKPKPASTSTADHGKFKELQKNFKTGPEVTEACLICHNEAAKQVQHTKHWTWESVDPKTGQKRGKKNIINNYCTSPVSNEKDCMACHAGYGWKDSSFDFTVEKNVDCLVCHDTTATYRKLPGDAGHPVYKRTEFPKGSGKFVEAVDLRKVAQSIGKPSRTNCGACHFFGGGANGAKHGDLSSSLQHPDRYLDVHMDEKGLNFTCATCHSTSSHQISGSRYNVAAAVKGPAHVRGKEDTVNPASCQSCHGDKPHPLARLNEHTDKIACQACHIPEYARDAIGTERSWDWSQATVMGPDGKPTVRKDSAGRRAFDSKKGAWVWESYVIPDYRWFNGASKFQVIGDKIDPGKTVLINEVGGGPNDPDSRIWPTNVHRGKQPYDKVNLTLTLQHTGGEDDTALWHNYDWQKAITAGMKAGGLPYSGQYGFVNTEQTWPITHMVAPKGDALTCAQCHSVNGRLKEIKGIYMPGRGDNNKLLDAAGWIVALLTLLGVIAHGAGRIYLSNRKG